MTGLNVLDVGSGTGFFAFEFERLGADVVSVELPSFEDWDRFPKEATEQMLEKCRHTLLGHRALTQEESDEIIEGGGRERLYNISLDGPFCFCHEMLDSKVERRYARIYDVSEETLGRGSFDIVFLGDVILDAFHPVMALAAANSLCTGTLILSQTMPSLLEPRPISPYIGGDTLGKDDAVRWPRNAACPEQIRLTLGFAHGGVVDRYSGVINATGYRYERSVLHATRK